jgi:hypothetical protein
MRVDEFGVLPAGKTAKPIHAPATRSFALSHTPITCKLRRFVSTQGRTKMSKISRNDPCPCGSGKKYKKCCGLKEQQARKPKLSNPIAILSQAVRGKEAPMDLARRVFKVISSTAQIPAKTDSEPAPTPGPRGFSSLEELIGVEGSPEKKDSQDPKTSV